jgi:hypothetical protein
MDDGIDFTHRSGVNPDPIGLLCQTELVHSVKTQPMGKGYILF